MKKYKVLKVFRNLETDEVYKVGQEIELEEARGKQILGRLKLYGGSYIEEIPSEEDPKGKELQGDQEDKKDKK